MTFGVNALDWTNIGRKLQTRLAETFRNETVGEALVETNLAAFSSMVGFPIYDGETGAKSTQYDMYIDRDEVDEGLATPSAEYAITTKENEDGEKIVIDRTLIPNFYIGSDADGNLLITQDVSLLTDDSLSYDDDGTPIPWNVSGVGGIQAQMSEVPIQEWANDLFNSIIDTDTGWAPDYQMTDGSLTSGDSNTQYVFDYQTVDEVSNSDGTSWLRLKQRNGTESIFYYLPYSSETEYTTLVDSIPAEFTFSDDLYLFPAGTELTAESVESGSVSTVEATSVSSTLLSSTYDTSLTDLNTAYEAVLSGDITGGGGNGGTTNGSDSCPDNATYNTTDAKCECNDDGTWNGAYKLNASNECVPGVGMIISSKLTDGKSAIVENKWVVAGGAFVLLGGIGWMSGLFRGSKKKERTLGQLLDKAVGSGKELEG